MIAEAVIVAASVYGAAFTATLVVVLRKARCARYIEWGKWEDGRFLVTRHRRCPQHADKLCGNQLCFDHYAERCKCARKEKS